MSLPPGVSCSVTTVPGEVGVLGAVRVVAEGPVAGDHQVSVGL
jgi:hypothetical protein